MNTNIAHNSIFYTQYLIPLKTYPKCQGQNQSFYFCENYYCIQEHSFICSQKQCPCQQQHRLCPKMDINKILGLIKSKISGTQKINQHIYQTIQNLIVKFHQFTQILLTQISQKIKYIGLSRAQKQFLKLFNVQNHSKTIKKQYLHELNKNSSFKQSKSLQLFNTIAKKVTNLSQSTKSYMNDIQLMTKNFTLNIKQDQNKVIKKQSILEYHINHNSNVLKQKNIIDTLFCQYFDKKPSHATLFYKGSQFNFNMKSYYQICQKIPNLLIVASNKQNDFIYGGYTPFTFEPTGKFNYLGQQWVKDPNKNSFIFKLSKKQQQSKKFKIQKNKEAIKRSQNKSIIQFGYDQFIISSNKENQSECFFNVSGTNYSCPKDYLNKKQIFTIKQWEVWKLEWNQQIKQNIIIPKEQASENEIIIEKQDIRKFNHKDKKTSLLTFSQEQKNQIIYMSQSEQIVEFSQII